MYKTIDILLCSAKPNVLLHWTKVFDELRQLRTYGLTGVETSQTHCFQQLEAIPEYIHQDVASRKGYVVISDQLVSEVQDDLHGKLKDYLNELPSLPIINISLSPIDRPHNDIDATLPVFCSAKESTAKLRILLRKLSYLFKPRTGHRREIKVFCRALRTFEEFRMALRLRRSVYETMGYLEASFLQTRSSLELNWYDFNSVHFGAFVKGSHENEKLVGTARLIMTKPRLPQALDWCGRIVDANPFLKRMVSKERDELANFKLPAFRSLSLNEQMKQAGQSPQPWSELSRVIVKPQWRGRGYSKEIIKNVIAFAELQKVQTMLLECLEIHAPMYSEYGFQELGHKGAIVSVGRTMVGMSRTFIPAQPPVAAQPIETTT